MFKKLSRRKFLNLLSGSILLCRALPAESKTKSKHPNFIVILAEAQGWTSSSVQMDDRNPLSKNPVYRTPNIEKLAAEGMRFADAYAGSPRCTPSRASLMTGKTPALLHMTFVNDKGDRKSIGVERKLLPPTPVLELPSEEMTIADLLKKYGYATAHYGKWHLGRTDPSEHGFASSDGPTSNIGPSGKMHPNPEEAFGMSERAISFITANVKEGKPFFVQVSHYGGRDPENALPETYEAMTKLSDGRRSKETAAAAVVADMDTSIGMILKKIEQLGISDNTYIIYTADHGAPGQHANEPLFGGKGSLWEGGIRVPLIIKGPGIKADVCCHTPVAAFDLLPTVAELAHIKDPLPSAIEGGSIASLLLNSGHGNVSRKIEGMVFHYPHYDHDNDGPATAYLADNLVAIKNYESGRLYLFDLSSDLSESHDLSQKMPDKAKEMEECMSRYLKSVNAQMPTQNPNYDPSKTEQQENNGGRRGRGEGKRERGRGEGKRDRGRNSEGMQRKRNQEE